LKRLLLSGIPRVAHQRGSHEGLPTSTTTARPIMSGPLYAAGFGVARQAPLSSLLIERRGLVMKTAILGIVLLFAVPFAAPAAESDLYGTWKLVSLNSKLIDT